MSRNCDSEASCSWQYSCNTGIQRNLCSFTWTLENVSFLQEAGDVIGSEKFFCCKNSNCNWVLKFYPKGRTVDQECSTFTLHFNSRENESVYASLKFTLRKANNQIFYKYRGSHNFKGDGAGLGFKTLKFHEMQKELMNDVLKIHVEMTVIDQKKQESLNDTNTKRINVCTTKAEFEKSSLSWTVQNFTSLVHLPPKSLSSKHFPEDDDEDLNFIWFLELKAERSEDKTSKILVGLVPQYTAYEDYHLVKFRIIVKDSMNRIYKTFSDRSMFKDGAIYYTIGEEKELMHQFKDDILLLHVNILAMSDTIDVKKFPVITYEQNCKLADVFATMFKKGEHCDINVFVKEKKLAAHRAVLAVRSPVFCSMLEHDTQEKQEGKVYIEDLSFDTMMNVLIFMYTNKFSAEDDERAIEVLKASDKYQMDDLKKICEDYLILNLNTSNARNILAVAETYNASRLKSETTNFVNLYVDDFISSFNDL